MTSKFTVRGSSHFSTHIHSQSTVILPIPSAFDPTHCLATRRATCSACSLRFLIATIRSVFISAAQALEKQPRKQRWRAGHLRNSDPNVAKRTPTPVNVKSARMFRGMHHASNSRPQSNKPYCTDWAKQHVEPQTQSLQNLVSERQTLHMLVLHSLEPLLVHCR